MFLSSPADSNWSCNRSLHMKPKGGLAHLATSCTFLSCALSRFSSLAAEHKCNFFLFVAMPLSLWDITWYSLQWATVCLFLIHRPPQHHGIFNCIFYSPIHWANLRMLQKGKWGFQHSWQWAEEENLLMRSQNEHKAFQCHNSAFL